MLALGPLAIGALIGLVLGLLGGGGAILAVPGLVYVLGVEPHAAIAASLAWCLSRQPWCGQTPTTTSQLSCPSLVRLPLSAEAFFGRAALRAKRSRRCETGVARAL